MPRVSLRQVTEQDAGDLSVLTNELGYESTTERMRERIDRLILSPEDLVIVAVDEGDKPIGWLQAHRAIVVESGLRVEILGLVVSSHVRRTGVGRALVAAAEDWAKLQGADVVVVRSNVSRQESHAFYPALGYRMTKTQHVYRKTLR